MILDYDIIVIGGERRMRSSCRGASRLADAATYDGYAGQNGVDVRNQQ